MRYLRTDIPNRPDLKQLAVDWCNEHGINPNIVPVYGALSFEDDFIEIQVYDTTAAGQPQWDEKTNGPKLRLLRVKCKSPFPEECLQ